jgi:hypothetical protein
MLKTECLVSSTSRALADQVAAYDDSLNMADSRDIAERVSGNPDQISAFAGFECPNFLCAAAH